MIKLTKMKAGSKAKTSLPEGQFASGSDEMMTRMRDKIIFSLLVSYVIIVTLAIITARLLGHTEKSEWLIYEISSVAIFALIAILGRAKKITNNSYFNRIIKLSPVIGLALFLTHLIFLTFFFRVVNYSYWAFLLLGVAASLLFYKKNSEALTQFILVNSVLLFCVEGYFFEYFNIFKIPEYVLVLVVWLLLNLCLILLGNFKIKMPAVLIKIISVAVFLIVILVAFNSTRKIMDYWNYSNIVGPVYELSLGKSLLSDIPSLYGYLTIHFAKLILAPFGINFENFHFFNTTLFFLYYFGFYLAYKKIFKDNLFTGLFSLVTTLLNTRFYVSEVRSLPPSWGPLRHGIGLLIVLALLYLPEKINFWVISLLTAVTVFWSPEVAIYVVPAFMFILLVKAVSQGQKFAKTLTLLTTSLIPFMIFTLILFFLIFFKEYGYYQTFPNFSNYFLFAGLFKNTPIVGSLIMRAPIFGNYYLVVLVLIVGLCLVFFQEWDVQKNRLLIPLSFLAIYNVAVFSYFVSNSFPITLNVISCFILLELAIVFQYFRGNKHFWSRIFLPGTLFITGFAIICTWNILGFPPKTYEKDLNANKKALADYQTVKRVYNLTSENVLILSKFYDTPLIIANQIKTVLPLNPIATTILIPNYVEKHLVPNFSKIKSGTKLVYTEDLPPEFSDFLNQNFIIEEINPQMRVGIFRVYNFRPR